MGAAIARVLSDAGLRVVVLETGIHATIRSGCHITADDRMTFASEARNRLTRGLLVPMEVVTSAIGRGAEFAVGAGSGGAGLIWSGICERLDAPTVEGHDFLEACVAHMYRSAEDLLGVMDAIDGSATTALTALPGVRPLRTASVRDGSVLHVPGPRDLLRCGGGTALDLRLGRMATTVEYSGRRARGIRALNLTTKEEELYVGETVVIAADAVRSPALLVASKIGPEAGFPVGQFLTDHPLAVARVTATTVEGRALANALSPRPEATTCQGVALAQGPGGCSRFILNVPSQHGSQDTLMFYWYAVGRPDSNNGLSFESRTDQGFGLGGAAVCLNSPMAVEEDIQSQLDDLNEVVNRLGAPLRGWRPRLLPLGASQHLFGTLRTAANGLGVTDIDGRVRGFDNLFVAGPARLPANCATNPVLASMAAALHTARVISGALPACSEP